MSTIFRFEVRGVPVARLIRKSGASFLRSMAEGLREAATARHDAAARVRPVEHARGGIS